MKKNRTILVLIILLRLFSANCQEWPFHNNTPGTITGVAGEIRDTRGNTTNDNNIHVRFHGGVDMITANLEQNQQYKVYAVADGVITWNPPATGTYCWTAKVTVGDYIYKHIERAPNLISGTNIEAGTYIGTMFDTPGACRCVCLTSKRR